MFFVYIVKCSDGFYYTGVTNDLTRRINEHNLRTIAGLYPFCHSIFRRRAT
jgi:putative endonuclease